MKGFEQLGFDISVQHGVCSVNEHSESHYNLQNTSFAPLTTVLYGRFPLAKYPHRTPQKIDVKLGGYPSANYCIRITNPYRLHPVSQR